MTETPARKWGVLVRVVDCCEAEANATEGPHGVEHDDWCPGSSRLPCCGGEARPRTHHRSRCTQSVATH